MAIHTLGKGGTEARFLLAAPIASIAQLDRVLVFETMGREFESLWGHQLVTELLETARANAVCDIAGVATQNLYH